MSFEFMGVDWDLEVYSTPEEFYIESIKISDGDELIDEFTELFIEKITEALKSYLIKHSGD